MWTNLPLVLFSSLCIQCHDIDWQQSAVDYVSYHLSRSQTRNSPLLTSKYWSPAAITSSRIWLLVAHYASKDTL